MTSLTPIAASWSNARTMIDARAAAGTRGAAPASAPVVEAKAQPAAPPSSSSIVDPAGSTGSLMRTASEQLDQFDRVLEKLRASMAAGAVTYGGAPAAGATGMMVDRLA